VGIIRHVEKWGGGGGRGKRFAERVFAFVHVHPKSTESTFSKSLSASVLSTGYTPSADLLSQTNQGACPMSVEQQHLQELFDTMRGGREESMVELAAAAIMMSDAHAIDLHNASLIRAGAGPCPKAKQRIVTLDVDSTAVVHVCNATNTPASRVRPSSNMQGDFLFMCEEIVDSNEILVPCEFVDLASGRTHARDSTLSLLHRSTRSSCPPGGVAVRRRRPCGASLGPG